MEPESMSELPRCPSPAPVKLTWGEIMDSEDNEMENVEPFCFYNPWSMDYINQVEEQKVEKDIEEQKAEEQAKVQQPPVRNTKLLNERLSKNNKCTSPAPAKLTWGEIMDAEDNEMENVEPFSFYNPWSMDIISQVEEQKAEEQKVEEQKVEEQKAEEQARVQQLPVSDKKLPNERLCKNKKTVKLLLRNLDCNVDDRQLHEEFHPFGTVISAEVNMENGHPKGTGFVIFASPDEARNAIMKMNGRVLGSRPVYVSVVQSKEEHGGRHRERAESSLKEPCPNPHQAQKNIQPQNASPELRRTNQQDRNICRAQTTLQSQDAQKSKVFIKHLDYSVDDRRLHEAFLPYGTVISAKVTVENGCSRGFGFVSFSSPNEAEKAIKEMNGRMMGRKPLYVTLANNNKQRKASLTQTECTGSSGPTEPHTRPHRFLQRVHSHRRPSVAPATR
ncbi:polyadenylate-binding protein 1-A-like [Hemibagrus wyckioides]|uniref:polyadenylate-binding protein 1-A-like n=1 Tax=Hemibagrus wyckioides TaxID=337641 RepID=UPI00266BD7CB|nr:polyadenylate-binding protein 1-A-like [Hemibagrus wyckioides]